MMNNFNCLIDLKNLKRLNRFTIHQMLCGNRNGYQSFAATRRCCGDAMASGYPAGHILLRHIRDAHLPCNAFPDLVRLDRAERTANGQGDLKHADDRACRRRPQHPDLGVDRAGSGRLQASRPIPTAPRRWTALQARPPDLAIFDIKMPRMDGMELLRRLRQKSRSAGDLPHLQGRRDRRVVRPQDGRRRFHPQAVLAAPAGRARQGRAAPRRRREVEPGAKPGTGDGSQARWSAATW